MFPVFQEMMKYPSMRGQAIQGMLAMRGAPQSPTSLMQNVRSMGHEPGSPAYNEIMRANLTKPLVGGAANPMDVPLKSAELERYVGPDGDPPDRIMTPRELNAAGYKYQRKPTESDRRSGYVADSLSTASEAVEDILADPEFDPTSVTESARAISNWTASAKYQRYKAAADEWATNMVFLRSGATAREEEKTAAFSNFWPQPGDKKETRDFKTRLRLQQEVNAYNMATMGGRITSEKAKEKIRQIERKLQNLGGNQSYDDLPP
jgi:hypothetical protein